MKTRKKLKKRKLKDGNALSASVKSIRATLASLSVLIFSTPSALEST